MAVNLNRILPQVERNALYGSISTFEASVMLFVANSVLLFKFGAISTISLLPI